MLIDKIFYVNDKGYDESQIDAIVEKNYFKLFMEERSICN